MSNSSINRFKTISKDEINEYEESFKQKQKIENEYHQIKEKHDKVMKKLQNFEKVDDNLLTESCKFRYIDEYYKNPECLPIDQVIIYLENGDTMLEIGAIASYWTESWTYGYYEDSISLLNLIKLSEGFTWLANLPFYKFWSQIFLVKNTTKAIKSFICQNNLYFHSLIADANEYNKYYSEMLNANYKIILRLIQAEESPMEKLSSSLHKSILMNIFSYDMIFPICKLYKYNSQTPKLLRFLFEINGDLRINGLALIGIECKNALPFLSDSLSKLPTIFKNNPKHIHLLILLLLNFIEELCAIECLLKVYPPFRFVVQYLQLEQQIIDYIGSHLMVVGQILKKLTEFHEPHINHNYLWDKYNNVIINILKIYRIFVNETIDDVEKAQYYGDVQLSKIRLQKSTKRYIQLIKNLFQYNFLSKRYIYMYNIQQDNGRLIKAFYEISETDRKLLNDLLKNAEILQKNYADGEKFDEINVENFNLTPEDIIHSYGPNYKLDLTKAITKQMKIDEMKNEALASNGEDEPNEEDFNKSTEQCLSKGLIRAVNDYKCDFNYQLHVGLDFKPKIHLDSDETQEDKQERLRKLDAKVEKIYQRYMERKHKKKLEKSTSHEDNHDTTSSIANGNIDNGLSSYNDEDADMKRALAESLKETVTVKDDLPDTDDVVFQSLISQVKDILPHLGEGYIKECLKHFNNNSEETISAILEQRLPPELTSIDENLPIIPADTEKPKRNVFEGDEFDRMTKSDFDPTRIFRKKNKVGYRNAMDMLNDKTHIKKEVYEQYSLDYYDDDYDDDVKEIDLGEREVEEVDDIEQIRCPINQPIEEDEDSSEEDDETPKPPSNAFCEDPAVLRARAEERRRQKYQKKGFQKPTQESRGDVVGNPKGQGQEKNVVISRAKKDQNKSQRANHNRRSGAQWKRSRGMIPS